MLRNRLPVPAGLLAGLLLLPFASTGCRSAGGAYGRPAPQPAPPTLAGAGAPGQGWEEDFPQPGDVKSVGQYQAGGTTLDLESFSALLLEPSPSADFAIDQAPAARQAAARGAGAASPSHELEFRDPQPALKPSTGPDPTRFYDRAAGSISALGWVDVAFRDVRVTGTVNVLGGPGGQGAFSRQGVMARWDLGNNFYWFDVDFAGGTFEIIRARYFGVIDPLPGSTGKVVDFKSAGAYVLVLEIVGNTLQGRVYETNQDGQPGRLVGDTGKVVDPDPNNEGVSGFLAEPAIESPFTPLEASFGTLASEAIGGSQPTAVTAPRIPSVPSVAQARFQRGRALAQQGDAEQAVSQLNEALKAAPDYIEAQVELAWIRATNEDAKLRNPAQAVELAEKAVGGIVELYDRRRLLPAPEPGQERFSKSFLIRAGLTLAAAYASAGRFDSTPAPGAGEQFRNIATGAGVSAAQLRAAAADCAGMPAVETATWAVTFAEQEEQRTHSPEARQLLQAGREMLAAFRAGRPVTGKALLP